MDDQTMIKLQRNSNSDESPSATMTGSLSDLVGDITALAELQFELFQVDTAEATRTATKSIIGLVAAILIFAGSVPVLILTLAALLYELVHWSMSLSLMISVLTGLVAAGLLAWMSSAKISDALAAFDRSRTELRKNVTWLKNLKRNRELVSNFNERREAEASRA